MLYLAPAYRSKVSHNGLLSLRLYTGMHSHRAGVDLGRPARSGARKQITEDDIQYAQICAAQLRLQEKRLIGDCYLELRARLAGISKVTTILDELKL